MLFRSIDKINNNKNKIYDYFKKNRTSNSKILDEYFMNNQKPDKNTLEMLDSKEISKITNDLSECLKYIINDTN